MARKIPSWHAIESCCVMAGRNFGPIDRVAAIKNGALKIGRGSCNGSTYNWVLENLKLKKKNCNKLTKLGESAILAWFGDQITDE